MTQPRDDYVVHNEAPPADPDAAAKLLCAMTHSRQPHESCPWTMPSGDGQAREVRD